MRHAILLEDSGPRGQIMASAIESCVHCGFCLPACPTYELLGEEMDSPRGRIFLMKEVLEGQLALDEALPYLDRCLGCQACVPACPSGVAYGDLFLSFRAHAEPKRKRPLPKRMARTLVHRLLPAPGRFRVAAALANAGRPLHGVAPQALRPMLDMVPAHLPAPQELPEVYPAQGKRRARVALLAGCVQQVLAPEINMATLRVLSRNGIEVIIPRQQGCCGALAMHAGEEGRALGLSPGKSEGLPNRHRWRHHQCRRLRVGHQRVPGVVQRHSRRRRRRRSGGDNPRHQRVSG